MDMRETLIGNAVVLSLLIGGGEIVSAHKAIQSLNIEGIDLETALMEIQAKRIQLLDEQLRAQTVVVEQKYQEMIRLNEQIAALYNEGVATLDQQMEALKAQLDAVSNSHHIKIQYLQSLKKKRNEVMTNFMKTMQGHRSAIFENLR